MYGHFVQAPSVFLVVTALAVSAAPAGAKQPKCDHSLKDRSAEEVLDDHRAALAVGDWEAVGCNYAEDAKVISDGGVIEGRDAIVAALQGFAGFFGGAVPMVNEEVIVQILNHNTDMARVLFSISTPCVDIPDGADTYIIKKGKIEAQTAHGFPVFKCGPPPGPPPG
jgi:hypothetical protein